jgi:hypothetical protein
MKVNAMVVFYPPNTQVVDHRKNQPGDNPQIQMIFKVLPMVGHVIEAPNKSLPSAAYRVALVYHDIHGDLVIKAIPA